MCYLIPSLLDKKNRYSAAKLKRERKESYEVEERESEFFFQKIGGAHGKQNFSCPAHQHPPPKKKLQLI
jgi:hypothetical protein